MNKLIKTSALAVATTLGFASVGIEAKEVVFKPVDQNLETQVCYVAVTEGLPAVKVLLRQNRESYNVFKQSLTCNGLSLADFANEYGNTAPNILVEFKQAHEKELTDMQTRVAFVAKNANVESQLCIDAVTIGEKAAREKHGIYSEVLCNSRNLTDFVRSFKNQAVVDHNTVAQNIVDYSAK